MTDTLSQHEIDHLLGGLNLGVSQVPTSFTSRNAGDVSSYDFRRPNRISKNQVRTIHNVHDTFAEAFSYFLVSKLQTMATISVTSVDQLFYSEYILSVSNPSCLYVFDIEGTDGKGIFEISPQLALCLVERLLGGSAEQQRKPRSITPIEQAVMQSVADQAFSSLSTAWNSIAELQFKFNRFDSEADFVQIAPSSEIVMVVSFDVNIGLNTYLMNLCFPTFALEDVIARLNRQSVTSTGATAHNPERERENIRVMKQQLSSQHLGVSSELGKATISLQDLIALKLGDVIKLDTKINQEIQIAIDGKRKLAGRPGTVDGKKAVRITRLLVEDDNVEPNTWHHGEPI
ncbi:MAG: flagellar motor switch protein FliM [Candidatus Kapabacteria bacterium]|nr:flagellar motor switch protein FliM [Candidatus Kapabacteria bacterium]